MMNDYLLPLAVSIHLGFAVGLLIMLVVRADKRFRGRAFDKRYIFARSFSLALGFLGTLGLALLIGRVPQFSSGWLPGVGAILGLLMLAIVDWVSPVLFGRNGREDDRSR